MSELCLIGEEVLVSGSLFVKDCKGKATAETEAATWLN